MSNRRILDLAVRGKEFLETQKIRIGGQELHHYAIEFLRDTSSGSWEWWLLGRVNNDPRHGKNAAKEDALGRRGHRDKTAETAVGNASKQGW